MDNRFSGCNVHQHKKPLKRLGFLRGSFNTQLKQGVNEKVIPATEL
jgi:hypothetical protein